MQWSEPPAFPRDVRALHDRRLGLNKPGSGNGLSRAHGNPLSLAETLSCKSARKSNPLSFLVTKMREEAPALGALPAAVGRGRTRTAGTVALTPADPVRASRPEAPAPRLERFAELDQTPALRSVLLHPGDPVQGPHA